GRATCRELAPISGELATSLRETARHRGATCARRARHGRVYAARGAASDLEAGRAARDRGVWRGTRATAAGIAGTGAAATVSTDAAAGVDDRRPPEHRVVSCPDRAGCDSGGDDR